MEKTSSKVEKFEQYIENKLKKDLRDIEDLLNKKADDYKSWQDLKNFVEHIQNYKSDELTTKFNFGLGIFIAARIEQVDKLIVNIGCGCYLEMYYDEADKYVDLRMKYLKMEIDFLRQQSAAVKAHIKLVLLGIGELKGTNKF